MQRKIARRVKGSNSKVRNATKVEIDGIKFQSKFEGKAYNKLKAIGFNFKYEPESFVVFDKFEFQGEKVRAISIKPDFVDYDNKVIIEIKGWATDTFKLRWKLFKSYIKNNKPDFKIYLINKVAELDILIDKLKEDKKNVQSTSLCYKRV